MLGCVLIASTYPLVVDVSMGAGESPWGFHVGALLGKVVSTTLFLGLLYPELRQRSVVTLVLRRAFGWLAWWRFAGDPTESKKQQRSALLILASTYSHVSLVFFVWSTQFVDTVVSAIIVGAFPALFVLLMSRQDRAIGSRGRYRRPTAGKHSRIDVGLLWDGGGYMGRRHCGQYAGFVFADTGGCLPGGLNYHGRGVDGKELQVGRRPGQRGRRERNASRVEVGDGRLWSWKPAVPASCRGHSRDERMANVFNGFHNSCPVRPGGHVSLQHAVHQGQSAHTKPVGQQPDYVQTLFSLLWLWLFTTIEVGNQTLVLAGATTVIVANVLSGGVGDWIGDKVNRHRQGGRAGQSNTG